MDANTPGTRVTLDTQLNDFWTREATRLEAMAAQARFGWQKRRLLRKAVSARHQAERSWQRETARHAGPSGDPPTDSLG